MTPKPPIQVAIAIVEREGEYLVGVRPEGVPLAGTIEFPGGKVEPGESPREAAVRECREETGLEVRVHEELLVHEHQYEHGAVALHFFLCTPADTARAPNSTFFWRRLQELLKCEMPVANWRVLRLLESRFGSR